MAMAWAANPPHGPMIVPARRLVAWCQMSEPRKVHIPALKTSEAASTGWISRFAMDMSIRQYIAMCPKPENDG